jgi:hypothetical protein
MVPVVNMFPQKDKIHSGRSLLAQLDQEYVGWRAGGAPLRGEQLNYNRSFCPGARGKAQAENDGGEQCLKDFLHDTG